MKQKFCEKFPSKSCQYASSTGIAGKPKSAKSCHDKKTCVNMVDDKIIKTQKGFTGQQG